MIREATDQLTKGRKLRSELVQYLPHECASMAAMSWSVQRRTVIASASVCTVTLTLIIARPSTVATPDEGRLRRLDRHQSRAYCPVHYRIGARRLERRGESASTTTPLITSDGEQHTVAFSGKPCIDKPLQAFFIDRVQPPADLRC